jgi:hypothetical protein
MTAFGFDWPRERVPERSRTLVAKGRTVWIWPGIPLTSLRGGEIIPADAETIRFWVTRLHGPEALDKGILRSVAIAADCLKRGNETAAQAELNSLRLIELSQDGALLMRAIAPHIGIEALDLPLRASMQTWNAQDIALHLLIYKRHAEAAQGLAKGVMPFAPLGDGGWDPEKHPRWPAGAPDSQGGQFAPGDESGDDDGIILVARRPRRPRRQPPPSDFPDLPDRDMRGHNIDPDKFNIYVPNEEPPPEKRYGIVQDMAESLENAVRQGATSWVHAVFWRLVTIGWLQEKTTQYLYQLRANLDAPKTLEELQDGVAHPTMGYQIHHIVEFNKGDKDNFPESWLESRENLVEIPQMKHKEISDWFQTPNPEYTVDGREVSPSEYLRGKSWDEQYQFGLKILKRFKVLKP